MKKIIFALLFLSVVACPVSVESLEEYPCDDSRYRVDHIHAEREVIQEVEIKGTSIGGLKEFVVYSDKASKDNHYIPSGWIGDHGDIKMDDGVMDNPYSGTTSIKFSYSAKKTQNQGWGGVYWQNPANNWGSKIGGFDLTGMTKLTFWARGEKGGEIIQKFMIGGIKGMYPDSTVVEFGPIELTDTWKQYTINLAGRKLTYINGGFGWATTSELNNSGCVFYLDEIKFEADPLMKSDVRQSQDMPFYVYSDKGSLNNHFISSGWMGDYGDIKHDAFCKEDPYSGDTCIKIIYCGCVYQGARWAGMYWQNPANNWGGVDGGYNLSKATKLTFWARGAKGGEVVDEFKIGGISGKFSDSDTAGIGPITLNKEWTQYTIDLSGRDMSYIIGGFCWVANKDMNPEGFYLYLDEIRFE